MFYIYVCTYLHVTTFLGLVCMWTVHFCIGIRLPTLRCHNEFAPVYILSTGIWPLITTRSKVFGNHKSQLQFSSPVTSSVQNRCVRQHAGGTGCIHRGRRSRHSGKCITKNLKWSGTALRMTTGLVKERYWISSGMLILTNHPHYTGP